jgi:hypothetical protein
MKRSHRFVLVLTFLLVPALRLAAEEPDTGKANPAATKLLADARAARANWTNFPGFLADVEVNFDGKVTRGHVEVSPKGKVAIQMSDTDAKEWARRTLASIVGHRLDSGTSEPDTPCVFVDDVTDHPLGRAIRVVNDEFHSSYRIRDRQVIEVNRTTRDSRFTITVMKNLVNAEKKFLPASFVVNTWDQKGETFKSSVTHHQTWTRVGNFDLPRTTLVVTAATGKQEAVALQLSKYRLMAEKGK